MTTRFVPLAILFCSLGATAAPVGITYPAAMKK
jgi:hypothetical protein